MRNLTICCLVAVAGSTLANQPLERALQNTLDKWTYPRYAFNYAVNDPHTGDNKAQWENRDGDRVKGSYSLVEPDGSLRVVDYNADDHSGFNAVVKRLGPNLHPTGPVKSLTALPIVVAGNPASWNYHQVLWPAPTPLKSAWGMPRYGQPLMRAKPLRLKKNLAWKGLPRPTKFVTITTKKNGFKKWIAGPIPVIPGHVFVVKRKYRKY